MMKMRFGLVVVVMLLLAGCASGGSVDGGDSGGQTGAPVEIIEEAPTGVSGAAATATETAGAATENTSPPTQPAAPTAAAATAAATATEAGERFDTVTDVTLEGADGTTLAGTFFPAAADGSAAGAILLHQLGSDRQAWVDVGLVDALNAAGVHVLTVDMRGHGDTGGSQDWGLMAADLGVIVPYFAGLPQVDAGAVTLIGASIGSTMALYGAVETPGVARLVLLSPGLAYRQLDTLEPMAAYGDRPVLLVAAEQDTYSAETVRTLADVAVGAATVQVYDDGTHGTAMFAPHPDLIELVVGFVR